MKLQKLLFYTQSWHLRLYGDPLFDDGFARWTYGPVIPSLYHQLKEYGADEIPEQIKVVKGSKAEDNLRYVTRYVPPDDRDTQQLIDRIIDVYGNYSGSQLSAMTRANGTAWAKSGSADGGYMTFADMAENIHPGMAPEAHQCEA